MPTHDERIRSLVNAFASAQNQLITELETLNEDAAARKSPDDGWSPAQIGWHVAISNEWLSAALTGARPMAEPAPADFVENWAGISIPAKVKTFPQLEPPADASRAGAIEKLRFSGDQVASALQGLTLERATYCITFPFGTLSLYQVGEFVTAHVKRHVGQVQRTLAST